MINIIDKHNCCGCAACMQSCPKQCISFEEDGQGFRYPVVDKEQCIDCGLCEKVCLVLNPNEPRIPLKVFAAINPNEEIRLKSSSGGVFTLLAETVIAEGGCVFGARFDENLDVVHDYVETIKGLDAFRGSKYVQSRIGETYRRTLEFLKQGRKVLYTGTSCQIAGLMKCLRKDYDNLITVDVVCHGVPSPGVWRKYLEEIKSERSGWKKSVLSSSLKIMPTITDINFREKQLGGYSWKKFGFVVYKSPSKNYQNSILLSTIYNQDLYMKFFLNNLSLRPSCYKCPAKSGKSCADITLADFWGYDLKYSRWLDDKGVSLVLGYSSKGCALLEMLPDIEETDYEYALKYNPPIEHCVSETEYVSVFWKKYAEGGIRAASKVNKHFEVSFNHRLIEWLKRNIVKRIVK
ncbi:Coenzyme F420 hydrogenase/dehydrogenase, beta subunit C-terminal domain [Bacteroides sp. f07]|uniref:Coenzyme F420 hydrogenase/dehydrogenase, beta subunit C-terminal domain n=1 Tax=Bacteroides sp. f07 TaxID=3132704 RepID=UPI0036F34FFE